MEEAGSFASGGGEKLNRIKSLKQFPVLLVTSFRLTPGQFSILVIAWSQERPLEVELKSYALLKM